VAIPADAAANTRITCPASDVIVNEQSPTADGRGIVVNGLHIIGASSAAARRPGHQPRDSGVVCPNGKGSEIAEGLDAPDITFDKDATPSTARAGDTVTYNATVTNTSDAPVRRHLVHRPPETRCRVRVDLGGLRTEADDPGAGARRRRARTSSCARRTSSSRPKAS
jgi:hypothetical protein